MPLEITWEEKFYFDGEVPLNIIIDIFFILDIVLSFFTTYRDKHGKEIYSRKKIAKHYISHPRFLFDMLAVVGSSFLSQLSKYLKWFGVFKLVRITRVSKFIAGLNVYVD